MTIDFWIKKRFGSKKGLLRYYYFQLLLCLGFYKRYRSVDFSRVNRLVFVCAGNICRSPLGEAVARKHQVNSCSFGLDTRGGAKADQRAIDFAARANIDLNLHLTKTMENYQSQPNDLLVLMEPRHLNQLSEALRSMPITLAGLWLDKPVAYVHDPYNTCAEYFERCEMFVCSSTEQLIKKLKNN